MADWQKLSDRINHVAPSATLAVDSQAKAMKAAGIDVIGFGAGEPDFPTPDYVVEAAVAACRDPKNYKYTPTPGLPELRQAIADKTLRDSGFAVTPEQVVVIKGGRRAGGRCCLFLFPLPPPPPPPDTRYIGTAFPAMRIQATSAQNSSRFTSRLSGWSAGSWYCACTGDIQESSPPTPICAVSTRRNMCLGSGSSS